MTQEGKELLFKDLSARLPYGIKGTVEIEVSTGEYSIESGHLLFEEKEIDVELLGINSSTEDIEVYALNDNIDLCDYNYVIDDFIPYFRSMSSMTEEENRELTNLLDNDILSKGNPSDIMALACSMCVDWFNEHHFDYRNLIEEGLALEAPEGMYKID